MNDIGHLHQHIASADDFSFLANGELEHTACDVGDLTVRMAVQLATRTRLKLHLDDHQVVVVGHDLAIDFAGIGRALPLDIRVVDEGGALYCDGEGVNLLGRRGRGYLFIPKGI